MVQKNHLAMQKMRLLDDVQSKAKKLNLSSKKMVMK